MESRIECEMDDVGTAVNAGLRFPSRKVPNSHIAKSYHISSVNYPVACSLPAPRGVTIARACRQTERSRWGRVRGAMGKHATRIVCDRPGPMPVLPRSEHHFRSGVVKIRPAAKRSV